MKVLVTGATGFVGGRLVERLSAEGHAVVVLARDSDKARHLFPKNSYPEVEVCAYVPLESGDWQRAIEGCDAAINLAGEPIVGEPWSAKRKQAILESRQLGTRRLVEAIAAAHSKPRVLLSGSAIGYYGTDVRQNFEERSDPGKDFLAEVCVAWEAEANRAVDTRVVTLRTGIVLGHGGALARMLPIFRLGLGGKIGSGNQWFSWIHRDDLVSLILFAIANENIRGPLNGTAPHPVTNAEFTAALAKALGRPAFLPVPATAIQFALGEAAIVIVEGQKVLPTQALSHHFAFQYTTVDAALGDILN